MRSAPSACALGAALALACAPAAAAGAGFFFGFSDDSPKWYGSQAADPARALGARAFRITLRWEPGQTALSPQAVAELDQAAAATRGMRLVLAVYADAAANAPRTEQARRDYCAYVRAALDRHRSVRDVVVWNEPNKSFFWRPQFDASGASVAAADYGKLLARCWDVLHAAHPDVNLVAPATSARGNDNPSAESNVSHSPGNFIRKLGEHYRTTGRRRPLFDTVGHHVYGITAAEPPGARHPGKTISQGDHDKLIAALRDAFEGTAQPLPPATPIWYLEAGHQTRPDPDKAALYSGRETEPRPVSPAEQGEQAREAIRLAYCQPHVEAYFNFMLWDEHDLRGWQSGPFWADRSPKPSYVAFKATIAEATRGRIDCGRPERPAAPEDEAVVSAEPAATTPAATTAPAAARPTPRRPPQPPERLEAAPPPAEASPVTESTRAVRRWLGPATALAGAAALVAGAWFLRRRSRS